MVLEGDCLRVEKAISLLFTRTLPDVGVLFMSPQSSEIGKSGLSISASLPSFLLGV